MALSLITSPTSPNAAYLDGAGEFTYKDERAVTGTANDSGFLQITITGIGADVSVGDYIWYSELDGADDRDTAVAKITAEATNTITLDAVYDASYSGGNIRLMAAENFIVKTGYTGVSVQPKRTSQTLTVRADTDGIYRVNCLEAVKSRFNWGEARTSTQSDYDHQVQAVAYPSSISEPTNIILLKQRSGTSPQVPPIAYTNFRGLISSVESSIYKIRLETQSESILIANSATVVMRFFEGKETDILFDVAQNSADITVIPSLPDGLTFITDGINYTGLRISPDAPTLINSIYTIDNTSTGDRWQVDIRLQDATVTRTQCVNKELTLIWWHPDGGWWQYSFERLKTFKIDGNEATVLKNSEGIRSAISFEDIIEGIDLSTQLESEAILDALNTLFYSTQIYIASFTGSGSARAIDLSNLTPCFVQGGSFTEKNVNPYKAKINEFAITIYKGAEVISVGQ